MSQITTRLRPDGANYRAALRSLQQSDTCRIGHIDCGVGEHEGLGWKPGTPSPANIHLELGRDFMSATPLAPPLADLKIGPALIDDFTDWPDHGIKTLSIILSDIPGKLEGTAPGVQVIPMRIADGPVFQDQFQRDNMGKAVAALSDPALKVAVMSISMGNPGNLGFFQIFLSLLGARSKFNAQTIGAFNAAYDRGIVVVAAAGQVIDRMVYPARFMRSISVAGHGANRVTHYPDAAYDLQDQVDIWAQAVDINRAFARLDANGTVVRGFASDPEDTEGEVSGTSYAAPQVAAAAALWLNKYADDLPPIGAPEAWRRVEAFRHALREGADKRGLELQVPGRPIVSARLLNIERLLGKAPKLSGLIRRPEAR
ncbi:S8/S53 family peptidase [Rhodobacteraceae bacterium NNCM2]|nr:S8/S53 family peptidase [Coraliihabitans acroporae]